MESGHYAVTSMLSIDPMHPQDQAQDVMTRRIGYFSAGILICSLVLQRFAIPFGEAGVDVVFPVGFLLSFIGIMQGGLIFHRGRVILFALFTIWLLIDACVQAVAPNSYAVSYSISSLMQFLLVTVFCTLSFAVPVDETHCLRQAGNVLVVLAIAGILQFSAQVIGLSLFTFSTFIPAKLLFEAGYNPVIPAGIGTLMKSNGLFLLEPSMLSQAMAMALILEILVARRRLYLTLFAIALILSFSGTGWIIMASFLLTVGLTQGSRGVVIALIGGIMLMLLVFGIMFLLPAVANVFANRLDEVNQVGSSGYLRFVTPFMMLHRVFSANDWAWLTGIGAGAAERIDLPFAFGVNTPVKIVVEYGIPGLLLYLGLILRAERTRIQRAVLLPSMALLLITGGYQAFAPVLFPVFLLICVARFTAAQES